MNDVKETLENGLKNVNEQVVEGQRKLQEQIDDLAQKHGTPAGFGETARKSLGGIVANSEQIKALQSGNAKTVTIPGEIGVKAVVGDAGGVSDDPYAIQPQRSPMMGEAPRRRMALLDFLNVVSVSSNVFEYVALDGFTSNVGYQAAEGDLKNEQALPTALQTAPVVTLAAFLRCSEQALADAPGLQQFIDAHMRHAISEKLEAEIIAGAGGAGQMNGLINQATTYSGSTTGSPADFIGAAMVSLEADGWNPGAIVMNPSDWHAVRSERVNAGTEEYVTTGWQNPATPSIWGTPVITSPAMPTNEYLVMDPSQVAVLDRMQTRTELGRAGDDFLQNLIAIRTETRAGVVLFSPSSCLHLTGGVA